MKINLTLDLNEVNTLLNVLAKAPYELAEPLIKKISNQAQQQLADSQNQPISE